MRAAAIARLLEWARAGGAWWDGIEFVVDAGGNASTTATRTLPAGAPILRLPRSLMIVDSDLGLALDPEDALAVWLARRAASRWGPYVETLPRELPELPMFHGADDLAMLAGTAAYASALEAICDVADAHARLREPVPLADFTWGRAIVTSRGFHAPGTLEHRIALLPLVDILNHRPGDTTWTYDGTLAVTTERAFERGDEVCFSYGDRRSNSYLFVHYGFTLPDNPANEAELELGGTRVRVACLLDHRFVRALELAGDVDEIATAARRAIATLDAHPAPSGTRAWDRNCATVRAGERAVLEKLADVEVVRSLAADLHER